MAGRFSVGSGKRAGGGKGGRQDSSVASRIIRDTIRKGGRINEETFKKIVQAKLKEARNNSMNKLMDAKMAGNRRSANAQKSIDMMKEMYEANDAKKEAKEVVIVSRRYHNGKIDDKGRIFDVAGNMVGKVNVKNGQIMSINGDYVGKYASKSGKVYGQITDMIEKTSPYLLNQREVLRKQKIEDEEAAVSRAAGSGGLFGGSGHKIELDVWSRTPTNVFGNVQTDVWGRPVADVWGKTTSDSWGNAQVDMWGNQI